MGNSSSKRTNQHVSPVNVVFNVDTRCCDPCSNNAINYARSFDGNRSETVDWGRCKQDKNWCVDFDSKIDSQNKEQLESTVTLKLDCSCCYECPRKIEKVLNNFKGVRTSSINIQKKIITVTGTTNVEDLIKKLKKATKKNVELVQTKDEKICYCGCGGYDGYGGCAITNNRMGYYGHRHCGGQVCPPTILLFHDENPNACSVM